MGVEVEIKEEVAGVVEEINEEEDEVDKEEWDSLEI
jgi:hypothetical protein